MSVSFNCKCPERQKPVFERNWGVSQRNCHHSAFNGYRQTYSDYSTVHCLSCNATGRTKADYVTALPDVRLTQGVWQIEQTCACSKKFYTTNRIFKTCGACEERHHDNHVRLQLIAKKRSAVGLSEQEEKDLERLQKLVE